MRKNSWLVLLGMGPVLLAGCGDSGNGAAAAREGVESARARFNGGPTASLTKANGSTAIAETRRQKTGGESAMAGNPVGGGGGSTRAQSLGIRSIRLLDADSELASCADMEAGKDQGECSCPGGGSLAYDIPNLAALNASQELPDEVDIALTYSSCVLDGTKYDGSMGMLMSKKSVIDVSSTSKASSPSASSGSATAGTSYNMLTVAKNLTVGKETLNFAFAFNEGRFYYAPEVDAKGGYVLAEIGFSSDVTVIAQNGTFACDLDSSGKGECTSEDGKETIDVDPAKAESPTSSGSGDTGTSGPTDDTESPDSEADAEAE